MREAWDGAAFHGAKIALLCGERVLAYRRDRTPRIPNPGLWDLPGGGREGRESPDDTALRELEEEFGLRIGADRVRGRRCYPSVDHPGHRGWFLIGAITAAEIAAVRFGDEGEEWAMLETADFCARADAVPALQARLAACLAGIRR